jgi:hypothetical protein
MRPERARKRRPCKDKAAPRGGTDLISVTMSYVSLVIASHSLHPLPVRVMGINRAGSCQQCQVVVGSGQVRSGLVHPRAGQGRGRARPCASRVRACGPNWVAGLHQPGGTVGGRVKNQNQME